MRTVFMLDPRPFAEGDGRMLGFGARKYPTFTTPKANHAMRTETVFLEEGPIIVTSTRLIVGDSTYFLGGVNAVKTRTDTKARTFCFLVAGVTGFVSVRIMMGFY